MVVLVVHVHVKSEHLDQYLAHCESMLEPSRAEEACISYDYFSKTDDPTHVVFVEEWLSAEGLQAHFEMAHFKKFVSDTELYTEEVNLRQYEVSGFTDF